MGLKILLTDLLLRVTIGTDTLSDSGSVYSISRSRVSVLNVKVKGQCTRCKGQGSVYSMSRSRVSVLDVKVKGQCTEVKGQCTRYQGQGSAHTQNTRGYWVQLVCLTLEITVGTWKTVKSCTEKI